MAVGGLLVSLATITAAAAEPVEITMHGLGGAIVPHSIAFSPAGSDTAGTMWFTDNAGGSLYMADPDDVDSKMEIPLGSGSGPRGVIAGPDAVWVAGYANSTLYRVPLTDGEPGEPEALDLEAELGLPANTARPSYIALTADGESAWVTLTGADTVVELTTDGALEDAVVQAHPTTENSVPTQIVEGPDGRLWYSEQSAVRRGVGAIARDGSVTDYQLPITGLAFGIAAGAEHVYVTDHNDGVVHQVGMNGAWRAEPWILPSGSRPRGIVVAQDNTGADATAWVVASGTGSLAQINLETGLLEEPIEIGAGSQPYAIASDPASNQFWGTANASSQLFSFSHQVVLSQTLQIESGDGQQIMTGSEFGPLAVRASAGGAAVEGAQVTFEIAGDGAYFWDGTNEVDTIEVSTGPDGVATTSNSLIAAVDLDDPLTPVDVTASTRGAAPVTFHLVVEGRAGSIEAVETELQTARQGTRFAVSPAARVLDEDGEPWHAGTAVTFEIQTGDATFVPEEGQPDQVRTVTTDALGVATAPAIVAGSDKGESQIEARTPVVTSGRAAFTYVTNGTPTTIEVPAQVLVAPGDYGRFTGRVLDQDGDPVHGEWITAVLTGAPAGISSPDGDTFRIRSGADGAIRFGAAGDGSDTFHVAPDVALGLDFLIALHSQAPSSVEVDLRVVVELGRM